MPGTVDLVRTRFLAFHADSDEDNHWQVFFHPDQESDREHEFYFDRKIWQDMDEPEIITITVEKGDTLNEDS